MHDMRGVSGSKWVLIQLGQELIVISHKKSSEVAVAIDAS